MPTTPEFAFFYPSGAGETYPYTSHAQIVQKVEELFLSVGEVIGTGFFSATDYNASVIAAQLNVTVNAPSRAVVGPAQARRLVFSNSATVVGVGNADGVPVASTTNYFFLKKNGLFHIDQDNSNPGDGAILAFSGVTNATEFTSINNLPTGRVNLSTILSLLTNKLDLAGGTLTDGANIAVGTVTGTKLATAVTQKLGFFNSAPVVQPLGADQAAVTLGNTDNEIGGLVISAAYTQAEVVSLRDKTEELADDVRNLSTLLHSIRTALVNTGIIKGSA